MTINNIRRLISQKKFDTDEMICGKRKKKCTANRNGLLIYQCESEEKRKNTRGGTDRHRIGVRRARV